jgi:hypothetical protein
MRVQLLLPFGCFVVFAGMAALGRAADNCAQTLVEKLLAQRSELTECTIYAATPNAHTASLSAVASTDSSRRGKPADAAQLDVAKADAPHFGRTAMGNRYQGILPLYDLCDRAIGLIQMQAVWAAADDEPRLVNLMTALRNQLKLSLASQSELFAAAPGPVLYAQHLVDRVRGSHPELIRCSLHLVPPGARPRNSMNVAYSDVQPLIRLGGHSDHDEDFGVITTGRPLFYYWAKTPFNAEPMYKAALPLFDRRGAQLGALILGYRVAAIPDQRVLESLASQLRDALKIYIPSNAAMFTGERPPEKYYAQQLVDEVAARHSDTVLLAAIATVPPGAPISQAYTIASTDTWDWGAPADTAIFDALTTGDPRRFDLNGERTRWVMPLYERTGLQAGVLILVLKSNHAEAASGSRTQALAIRDELKARIPGLDGLFEAEPNRSPPAVEPRSVPAAEAATPAAQGGGTESRIYAQVLVDEATRQYPKLRRICVQTNRMGTEPFEVIASAGRAAGQALRGGAKSGVRDLEVETVFRDNKALVRTDPAEPGSVEVLLPLKTAPGKRIGVLSMSWPGTVGDSGDAARIEARATALRDELACKIPSTPSLYRVPAAWMSRQ